jgi:hypothetical protein
MVIEGIAVYPAVLDDLLDGDFVYRFAVEQLHK